MKGQSFLKITSILMIVGGIIAVIAGVIAILGVSALWPSQAARKGPAFSMPALSSSPSPPSSRSSPA